MDTPEQPASRPQDAERESGSDPSAIGPATLEAARKRGERIIDATALKALAHPLRVDMFDRLAMYGSATASQLADALAESSGATSYHLRQLARHGFIEEDAERGTARERYWQVKRGGMTMNPVEFERGSAEERAGALVVRQMAQQRARHIDDFIGRARDELGEGWVKASMLMATRSMLTAAELAEVNLEIASAIDQAMERFRDRDPVPGSRPVSLTYNGIPLVDAPDSEVH